PRVLECCTGSGAIGLAIASERPDATVILTELSPRAIAFAARNRARLGAELAARVSPVQGDLLEAFQGPVDAGVADPPHVAERERELLPRDVLDHEPGLALFAAEDGMAAIRRLIEDAPRVVRPGGLVALELGEGQGDTVEKRFRAHGAYADVRIRLD